VTETKIVVLFLLGVLKLLFGLAPLVLAPVLKRRNNGWHVKKFIGSILCIGGGVLLSTVFIHMLKEVRDSMDRAVDMGMMPKESDYPFAELIICMGFLLILLVESIVHKFFVGPGHGHVHASSTSMNEEKNSEISDSPNELTVKIPRVTGSQPMFDNPAFLEDASNTSSRTVKKCSEASPYFTSRKAEVTGNVYDLKANSYTLSTDSLAIKTPTKSKHSRDSKRLLASVRGILIVLALSVHSLFEGMAVGLEEESDGVWQLFLAIAIHSIAIVFCIGMELVSSGTRKPRIILSMVVLSIVTPLGVVLGITFTVHGQTENGPHVLLVGILQGIAGGTLLYITFFEVLSREKLARYGMSGLMGAFVIMLGFTLMAALNAVGGHSHGGGGHLRHASHSHDHFVENHIYEMEREDNYNYEHNIEGIQSRLAPYSRDHFHEEYDLDHGDHIHHIGAHDIHSHEDEDFYYDVDGQEHNRVQKEGESFDLHPRNDGAVTAVEDDLHEHLGDNHHNHHPDSKPSKNFGYSHVPGHGHDNDHDNVFDYGSVD